MKKQCKLLTLTLAILFVSNNLWADTPNKYINFQAGYGLGLGKLTTEELGNLTFDDNYFTYEQEAISFGQGFQFGADFGFMINNNIGIELGVSYLLGSESTLEYNDIIFDYYKKNIIQSQMLRVMPSIIISSGLEKWNPYAKFGMVIGAGSIFGSSSMIEDDDLISEEIKLYGGVALGANAGLGVLFNLSSNTSFFGELNMVNLAYAPSKGERTKLRINGVDELPNLTTSEKEFEFVKSYSQDFNSPPLESDPRKLPQQNYPFGSIGINLGIRFHF